MEYGICDLGIVSVRAEGDDRSEIVTQLLFGEHFQIIEEAQNWIQIQLEKDQYTGWICKNKTKSSILRKIDL